MKIIFLGHTSVHAALIAANIYLGKLSDDRLLMIEGLADISKDVSQPLYIGTDIKGTEVYTLGGGKDLWMVKKSIEDLRDILGFMPDDLIIEIISSRWDRLQSMLRKVPSFLGGRRLDHLISKILLRSEVNELKSLASKL